MHDKIKTIAMSHVARNIKKNLISTVTDHYKNPTFMGLFWSWNLNFYTYGIYSAPLQDKNFKSKKIFLVVCKMREQERENSKFITHDNSD